MATHLPESPLWSQLDAAAYLRVAPKTLANWRHARKGPRYVRFGGAAMGAARAFYRQVDLDAWLEAHTTTPEGHAREASV